MEDTAAVADDTAVDDSSSLLEAVAEIAEAQPEIDDDIDTSETEGDDAPETEPADPLASLTEDDIRKHPKVEKLLKDFEARTRESERRKAEKAKEEAQATEAAKLFEANLNQLRGQMGNAFLSRTADAVTTVVQKAVADWERSGDGKIEITPQEIYKVIAPTVPTLVNAILANGMKEGADVYEAYRKQTYADYKPDEEDVIAYERAKTAQDWKKLAAVNAVMLLKADRTKVEEKVRKDERAKVLSELKAKADADSANQKATERNSKPKPATPTTAKAVTGSGYSRDEMIDFMQNPNKMVRQFGDGWKQKTKEFREALNSQAVR